MAMPNFIAESIMPGAGSPPRPGLSRSVAHWGQMAEIAEGPRRPGRPARRSQEAVVAPAEAVGALTIRHGLARTAASGRPRFQLGLVASADPHELPTLASLARYWSSQPG